MQFGVQTSDSPQHMCGGEGRPSVVVLEQNLQVASRQQGTNAHHYWVMTALPALCVVCCRHLWVCGDGVSSCF